MKLKKKILLLWVIFALLDPDPDPGSGSRLNTNPDPDPIRIQGFNDQNLKKNFRSQKRPSNTSKHELKKKNSTFVGHFCPPGSGSGSANNPACNVTDTHHLDADPDANPDPVCHSFEADPDPIFRFDVDPNPSPSFQIKAQNLE